MWRVADCFIFFGGGALSELLVWLVFFGSCLSWAFISGKKRQQPKRSPEFKGSTHWGSPFHLRKHLRWQRCRESGGCGGCTKRPLETCHFKVERMDDEWKQMNDVWLYVGCPAVCYQVYGCNSVCISSPCRTYMHSLHVFGVCSYSWPSRERRSKIPSTHCLPPSSNCFFLPIRTVRRGFVGLFQPRNIRKPSGPLPAKSIRHGLSKSLDHFDVLGKKPVIPGSCGWNGWFYDLLWKNFVSFRCSYIFSLFLWKATCKSKKTPITTSFEALFFARLFGSISEISGFFFVGRFVVLAVKLCGFPAICIF